MTILQLIMLGASAFFAYKIYEHVQTLQEPEEKNADTFSPFDPESLIEKADEAFEEKDFQKALALLMEADAKKPDDSEILFKIAYILQQINDNDEALDYYKKALDLDADNEFIHNSIASIYRINGEYASAKMHLNASLNIDSTNPMTYYNFGNLLVDMNHTQEAKDMYAKALELNPDFNEAKEELEKL